MKKTKILIPIMLLFTLALIGIVQAADTLAIDPNDWVSTDEAMYFTPIFDAETSNCSTVNWTISDGTTTYWIGVNESAGSSVGWNATNVTHPMNVSGLSDDLGADAYTITAECFNSTNGVSLGSDTEVVGIDNTVPTCSFNSSISSNDVFIPTKTWRIEGLNASSATITFQGLAGQSMTESADNFTYSSAAGLPERIYKTIEGSTSDGYNTTTCTNLEYIKIDSDSTVKQVAIGLSEGVKKEAEADSNMILLFAGLAAGLYIWSKS